MSTMVNEKHGNALENSSETWDSIQKLTGKYFNAEVVHKSKHITTKKRTK